MIINKQFDSKVSAGGALIAEKISAVNNDRVTWLSADPVTGSYSSINKNGTSYGDARKEYEPLGQEVLTEAPPDEIDTAQPETSAVRSASEPEWLCGLSRINDLSFWEKPVQCQIASLESDNFFLGDLFSKGNAAHVSTAPPRGAASGQSGGAMPVNLTPTNKPSSTTSAATPLAIKNTPSADGCNYDSQGNPNCAVQSQGAEYNPFAGLSAENGGDDSPQIQTQVINRSFYTKEGANLLAGSAEFHLNNNPGCEDGLNLLLATLYSLTGKKPPGTIREIIETYRKQGLGLLAPYNSNYISTSGGGTAWGFKIAVDTNPNRSKSMIGIRLNGATHAIGFVEDELANYFAIGGTVLHELLHFAGGALQGTNEKLLPNRGGDSYYGDYDLIDAGNKLGYLPTIEKYMMDKGITNKTQALRDLSRMATAHFCDPLNYKK